MVASALPVGRVTVAVSPGAGRSGLVARHGSAWKIRVPAAPERGRANDDVVELLAAILGVRRRDVAIVRGHAAREKMVEVTGLAADDLNRRSERSPETNRRP